MSDPLIRDLSNYVVLTPGENETFLNPEETLSWLEGWLEKMDELPKDLKVKKSLREASQHLLDTACDLEIKPGFKLQWFAVRLNR